MANRLTVDAVFKAVDKMTAPINRMANRTSKFTRGFNRGVFSMNRALGRFTTGLKRMGTAAVISFALVGGALGNVISTGADFEQSLVNAFAKFNVSVEDAATVMGKLEEKAREVGRSTEFTATQSAEAFNFLAMAGFTAEQSIASLEGVMNLATVAQVDLGTATDIATDTLSAFGLATDDAAERANNLRMVNDVMATTITTSNANLEQMFETIKKAGPIATAAGVDIRDFSTLLGIMANRGVKASVGGTSLKNLFTSLAAPASMAGRIMKRLGIQIEDAGGNMRSPIKILDDLRQGLKGVSRVQRLAILKEIFGKQSLAGAAALMEATNDELVKFRENLENVDGAAEDMAATMRDTVRVKILKLKSAIESVKLSIFDLEKGPLADVIDRMTEWVGANEDLIATKVGDFLHALLDSLPTIWLWMQRIGKVFSVLLPLIVVFKAVSLAASVLQGVMLLLALPFGAIILVIGLVIAAIWMLVRNWDGVVGGLKIIWGQMKDAFNGVAKWWDDKISALPDPIEKAVRVMGTLFENFFLWPLKIIENWEPIVELFDNIGNSISNAFGAAKDFLGFGGGGLLGETGINAPALAGGAGVGGPQVVSQADKITRAITEERKTSTTEVTLKDETGRAEITGQQGKQNNVKLLQTGKFG